MNFVEDETINVHWLVYKKENIPVFVPKDVKLFIVIQ